MKFECEYADNWKNKEGFLVLDNGKIVCLDWDCYCVKCRIDDSKDFIFEVK